MHSNEGHMLGAFILWIFIAISSSTKPQIYTQSLLIKARVLDMAQYSVT